jgi:hypothetical protein
VRLVAILAPLLLLAGSAVTAEAATPTPSPDHGFVGIRLLDVPGDRRNDPRAQIYIVDHLVPGAVIRRHIEVDSTIDAPLVVEMFVGAASISGGSFVGAADRARNELTDWMSLGHSSVTLPPKSNAPVEVVIQVPSTASSGERYAIVWAQVSSRPAVLGGVTLVNRVGIRVYLDVGPGGDPPSDFEIQDLSGARTRDGQPEVIAEVKNTGHRALDMRGDLRLSEGPGSLSAGPIPAKTGSTLAPGDTAGVVVLLDRQLPAGPWKAQLRLASGLLERTATATIRFPSTPGAKNAPETINWNPIILGVIGVPLLVSVGFLVHLLRRRRRLL